MNIARWAFTVSLATSLAVPLCAGRALAQDQQDNSVAAAARRAQEAKKDQPKAAKVYDNDSIPTTGAVNVVGQEQAAGGATTENSTAQTVQETKPAPTAAEMAGLNSDVAAAKQHLDDLKADLDVAQRKFTLDQQTYLSNPNHDMDKAGAAALDDEKADVAAKADAVAEAEKALAAAQAKLDAASQAATAAAAQDNAAQQQEAQAGSDNSAQTAQPAQPAAAPAPPPANPVVSDKDR
jgi:colicin import membrane protein